MTPENEIAPRLRQALAESPTRPLVVLGRTGTGKTRLLRSVVSRARHEVVHASARHLVEHMIKAIRDAHYPIYREAFTGDERHWFLEHVEDLRGLAATRDEVRRLLEERAARGHHTVLTMTRVRGDGEILEWLASWTELLALE